MKNIIAACFAILMCSACAPQYAIDVNSLSSPQFNRQEIHAITPTSQAQKDDLQFSEFAMQASRALIASGVHVNNDVARPDVAVTMTYGVSDPKLVTSVESRAIQGQTGVVARTTHGRRSVTTEYTPTYGIVGYENVPVTTTMYTSYLILSAKKFADAEKGVGPQLWKLTVESTTTSNDLRRAMPFMLAAARPYMGNSTSGTVEVIISADDELVNYIQTGNSVMKQ